MNSIILLGRTTSSIELKQTQAGKSVASFSLAVKRPYTKDTTDFHTIIAWDKQAELLSKYVKKGDQICIRGYLTNRSWTDNNGNKRYATEVMAEEVSFCGSAEKSDEPIVSIPGKPNGNKPYVPDAYAHKTEFEEIPQDESLPF